MTQAAGVTWRERDSDSSGSTCSAAAAATLPPRISLTCGARLAPRLLSVASSCPLDHRRGETYVQIPSDSRGGSEVRGQDSTAERADAAELRVQTE